MKHLVLFVGPAGSGKSTLAEKWSEYPHDYIYINQDEQGNQHFDLFKSALNREDCIVVDRMNFNKEQRSRYLDLAKANGYNTQIEVLHESLDTCLNRMKERKNHPTIKDEQTARKVVDFFFKSYERVDDNEADEVNRYWPEGYKEKAIWVDIDNTLANCDHREHFLKGEKKDWNSFFNAMTEDSVNEWCKFIVNTFFKEQTRVLLVSARPENYRQQTMDWLEKNNIMYDRLIMRPRNDFRKDSIVKEELYEFEIKTKYNLLFSIDDRKQVIDQIRKHGVVVLDCAGEKGEF